MGYWSGKRVFVTGHTGFKGSWLTAWLASEGAVVRGYSIGIPSQPSMFEALKLGERCEHRIGDICDVARIRQALVEFEPEIVFHMAAQPLVRYSYREPLETYRTNVFGTAAVLDACRASSSARVVVSITTDKVYENKESSTGYRETDTLGGHDPYSASKACAELVTKSYRQAFFSDGRLKLIAVRAGNIIGGGDWSEDRLIPDAVRAFSRGESVKIRNPRAIRPWQHVIDPLRGYLEVARKADLGELRPEDGAFNFGPPDAQCVPVETVLETLVKVWGAGAKWELVPSDTAMKETSVLKLDSNLALARVGWRAQIDLPSALALTADWYRAYYAQSPKLWDLTVAQLREHGALRV